MINVERELHTGRIGTTVALLCFNARYVFGCSLGDSLIYRMRNGELVQLSVDHVENRIARQRGKAPVTQYLGMDPEEVDIAPYVRKEKAKRGDQYLICSDGFTDMLINIEISKIIINHKILHLAYVI